MESVLKAVGSQDEGQGRCDDTYVWGLSQTSRAEMGPVDDDGSVAGLSLKDRTQPQPLTAQRPRHLAVSVAQPPKSNTGRLSKGTGRVVDRI